MSELWLSAADYQRWQAESLRQFRILNGWWWLKEENSKDT